MSEKIYNCKKCGKKAFVVTEYEDRTEGQCQECGASFVKQKGKRSGFIGTFFNTINKFSGIIAVLSIILVLVVFSMSDASIRNTDTKVNVVKNNLESYSSSFNSSVSTLTTHINNIFSSISSMDSRIVSTESGISNLNSLYGDIDYDLSSNISSITENITSIKTTINNLPNSVPSVDKNITVTFYANQTAATRYCYLDLTVEKASTNIKKLEFSTIYPKTNISLLNWSGNVKPQEYKWLNDTSYDNYYLHWFEANNKLTARFNITWNSADYNTSDLNLTKISNLISVNSIFVSNPTIWEVRNA